MAMNMEAVLRIAAKVTGAQEISALRDNLDSLNQSSGLARKSFNDAPKEANEGWASSALKVAGLTAAIGTSVMAAVQFESALADVRKVVDGLETPAALQEISGEILELSSQMPIAAEGFAQIYAAAGASGIARDELKGFAVMVAQVATAFEMTAEEAGRSLAQLRVSLGLSNKEVGSLADMMNYLENSTGASASQLVEFMTRSGATGQMAGLTAGQTAAFGAAMTQAGFETEVAATSFNNMVKALSRGPSMTERQVDALRRLGYSMADAKQIESELTREAETASRRRVDAARSQKDQVVRLAQEQSDRRIEIARDETDRLSREINRRYRNEQQALQDNWDDQAKIQEDRLQDRADAQIKALQRQERAEIDYVQKIAQAQKTDTTAAVDRIRDAYEARIEAVRDQVDRELTVQRRAARDQQQLIRDQLDDRRELELKANADRLSLVEKQEDAFMDGQKAAAEGRFKAIEEAEKSFVERAKANAKATGESLAKASTQSFADRMERDAIGTITEVLGKISNLPKSQQLSVISDLFGDEARALSPLINNIGELDRILALSNDSTKAAGSVLKEYATRSATAENQLKLLNNGFTQLRIELGNAFLPALAALLPPLTTVINASASLVKALQPAIRAVAGLLAFGYVVPSIVSFVGAISGVVAIFSATKWISGLALLAGLPGPIRLLAAAFTLLGVAASPLGPILNAVVIGLTALQFLNFAKSFIAFIPATVAALTGFISFLSSTVVPALLAFFSGPVGWTVLAIAAVVAMAIAFRKPIMEFFGWLGGAIANGLQALWKWGEPIRQFWIGVWEGIKGFATAYFEFLGGVATWGLNNVLAIANTLLVLPWVLLWTKVLRDPATAMFRWLLGTVTAGFKAVTVAIDNLFVKPWVLIWSKGIREPVSAAQEWLRSSVFEPLGKAFATDVTEPITNAWRAVTEFMPRAMQTVADFVQGLWTSMVGSIQNAVRGMFTLIATAANRVRTLVNVLISAYNRLASAVGGTELDLVGEITVPAFAQGGVVSRPTLAMVGEGGEREYIIPESKMQAASSRFLAGQRGAGVVPSGSSPSASTTSAPQISITTGPVMQQQDGSRWVSVEDFERGLQQVAEQMVGTLRTPQARTALGWS
jgi:hypothetical protein